MQGFTVLLDPTLREELYADITPEFLSFFILEAITIIISDPNHLMGRIIDGAVNYCDDEDSQFENSVTYLLEVWSDSDREAGMLATGEYYEFNSEYHELVCRKLHEAVAAVQNANDELSLGLIYQTLEDPAFSKAYTFCAHHFSDRIMFLITEGVISLFNLPLE